MSPLRVAPSLVLPRAQGRVPLPGLGWVRLRRDAAQRHLHVKLEGSSHLGSEVVGLQRKPGAAWAPGGASALPATLPEPLGAAPALPERQRDPTTLEPPLPHLVIAAQPDALCMDHVDQAPKGPDSKGPDPQVQVGMAQIAQRNGGLPPL